MYTLIYNKVIYDPHHSFFVFIKELYNYIVIIIVIAIDIKIEILREKTIWKLDDEDEDLFQIPILSSSSVFLV